MLHQEQDYINFRQDSPYGPLTKTVQPLQDPEIMHAFAGLSFAAAQEYFAKDVMLDCFRDEFDAWIRSADCFAVNGLERFPHRLLSQANTQSLDAFLLRHHRRRLRFFRGEYPYTPMAARDAGIEQAWLEADELRANDAVVLSYPFSATGKPHERSAEVLAAAERLQVPVLLDCAYFGATRDLELNITQSCIETVAFSLSKPTGLAHIRVGMEYTRAAKPGLKTLNDWYMLNRLGIYAAHQIIRRFPADYIPRKYSESYTALCGKLALEPVNVLLMGLGGEAYSNFDRMGVANRVGLAAALRNFHAAASGPQLAAAETGRQSLEL